MTTKTPELDACFSKIIAETDAKVLDMLAALGERCMDMSRRRMETDTFFNRMGNLRSSIGYAVAKDGQICKLSGFQVVLDGFDGANKGKAFATELAGSHSHGYSLDVVAGAEHASYVEAHDNKCVLKDAELFAEDELPGMMRQLNFSTR